MIVSLLAALAVLTPQDAPVVTAPPSTASIPIPSDIPLVAPAVAAPDCGGLLRAPAFCVTARMDEVGPLAESYMRQLEEKGWIAADGDDNRVVLVKRREAGGCDGMQMVAFFDTTKLQTAEAPAFLGFAYIPGDVCAAPGS